jgi:hypothetical protein
MALEKMPQVLIGCREDNQFGRITFFGWGKVRKSGSPEVRKSRVISICLKRGALITTAKRRGHFIALNWLLPCPWVAVWEAV